MLDKILELLETKSLFLRERKENQTRALAVALYRYGVSLRDTAEIVSHFEKASHESVRQWFHRFGKMTSILEKKDRKAVAIDETKVKIKRKWYYLWAAIDVDTKELLAIHLSSTRTPLDAMVVLRRVMMFCETKPFIFVDGGPWYRWALNRLGFRWQWITHGLRNAIEQWYAIFKSTKFHMGILYDRTDFARAKSVEEEREDFTIRLTRQRTPIHRWHGVRRL